jgi:hypothetical protein
MDLPIAAIPAEAASRHSVLSLLVSETTSHDVAPGPNARTRTNASLDPRVTAHLLLANLETAALPVVT